MLYTNLHGRTERYIYKVRFDRFGYFPLHCVLLPIFGLRVLVMLINVKVDGRSPVSSPPEPLIDFEADAGAMIKAFPIFMIPLLEFILIFTIDEAITISLLAIVKQYSTQIMSCLKICLLYN